MAVEFFSVFDNGRPRAEYLSVRARIRRAIDFEFGGIAPGRPPDVAIAEAAQKVGTYTYSNEMMAGEDLALDSADVAAAFVEKTAALARDLEAFLTSPIASVAGATEVRAEVALADVALTALCFISNAPDGLDARCEDLRQELNVLEALLDRSGERGEIEGWESTRANELSPDQGVRR